MLAFIKSADIRTYPKLSKTILPDHPLYPDNIMIGKRPKRQVYIPPVVNKPVTAKKPATDIPVSKKKTTSSAKDIPVSKKRTASPQSSKDIPISRRKPPNGGTKR